MAHSSQAELQLNTGSTGRGPLMVNPLRDSPILSWFVPPAPLWNGPLVPGFVGTGRTPQSCHNSIKIPLQLQFICIEWGFNRKCSPKIPAPNGSTPMEKLQIFGNSVGSINQGKCCPLLGSINAWFPPHNTGMQDTSWGSLEFMGFYGYLWIFPSPTGPQMNPGIPVPKALFGRT